MATLYRVSLSKHGHAIQGFFHPNSSLFSINEDAFGGQSSQGETKNVAVGGDKSFNAMQ
jgi:hypothetical protein